MTPSEMLPCVRPVILVTPKRPKPRQNRNQMGRSVNVQLISVNETILEAVEVAARLDAISSRDNREAILPTLQRAQKDYASLVEHRNALLPADTSVLDVMLENLQARLKFFENRL